MNEVAEATGVSIATVSRVINGSGGVSKKLERRVRQAMDQLHYHPSSIARSFNMQEALLIGILIPLLDHPFYSRLATAIEQNCSRATIALICNTEEDDQREREYIEMLVRQRVDGVMAIGVMHAAAEMGLSVPRDLSVIGYDDLPMASYMMPPLTTVAQPISEMGEAAVDMLFRQIDAPDAPPERSVLATRLVVRGTTMRM